MVILEGYSVAGVYIVVLGHNNRTFGCLGNLVMCFPPRRWRAKRHHYVIWQFVSGPQASSTKKIRVVIIDVMNCRNCELYKDCDISM